MPVALAEEVKPGEPRVVHDRRIAWAQPGLRHQGAHNCGAEPGCTLANDGGATPITVNG
jgi:hypothetical protein